MKKLLPVFCFMLCAVLLASCSLFGGKGEEVEDVLTFSDYNVYEPAGEAEEDESEELTITRPNDDDTQEEEPAEDGTVKVGDVILDSDNISNYVFFSLDFPETNPLTARGLFIGSFAEDVAAAYGDIVPALITASNTDNITYEEFLKRFNRYDNGLRAALYDYTVAYNAVDLDGTLVSIPLLLDWLDEEGRTLESYEKNGEPIPTYSLYFFITEGVVTDICIEVRGLSWQVILENSNEEPPPAEEQAEEGEPTEEE